MSKKDYIALGLIAVMFIASLLLMDQMPDEVATHWNSAGEPDGYMSKTMGLFFLPAVIVGVYILLLIVPKISIFKENFQSFIEYYHNIKLIIVAFMTLVHFSTLAFNLGYVFNMSIPVLLGIGVLFYYLGEMMPHIKRNFFVGVRTPWTLSNDNVWNKTHELAGKTFKINGIIIALSLIKPEFMIYVILATVFGNVGLLFAYSYLIYRKEGKREL